MANPKASRGFLRRLLTPPGVMVATTALVFLSLSDHRVESIEGAPAQKAVVASAPTAVVVSDVVSARPRDRLVVAAVVAANLDRGSDSEPATVAPAQTRQDWEGDALVGPLLPVVAQELPPAEIELEAAAEMATVAEVAATAVAPAPVVSAATKSAQHRHALTFEPLREPALTGAASGQGVAAKKGFQALVAAEEEHTVHYLREVTYEVRKGETLSTVFSRQGLSPGSVNAWLAAVKEQYNPNRIYAGQSISMLIDMPEKQLRRVKFETGGDASITIEDTGAKFVAKQKNAPYESNIRVVEGEISSSLYAVASAKGVPEQIISEAAEVLGWEINLGRDLQRGARFRLAYEEAMRVDTRESSPARLLAIELSNQGERYEGFRFASTDGKRAAYYSRKGEGLGRAFLRYPVSFSRVSSPFSTARFHPVLKRSKPHYGVDFAAPTGTPVKAVADGAVTVAGWQGGNGRFVKIRHDKQYESGYAHLSRIASGMRPGARVKQGQVIGYVGSTGLATGPHLHFAMYSNGKYVDPMRTALPRTTPLSGSALASFKSQVAKVEKVYAANGMTTFGAPKVATAAAKRR